MQFPDSDLPEIVFSYSRADAIRDGVLIEVPAVLAKEAGLRYPVTISAELWFGTVEPDEKSLAAGQSVQGRLWDILQVFRHFAKRTEGSLLIFPVSFLFNGCEHRDVRIKSICGPGDTPEPVITMMHEHED